jgi:cytoskeletal protein RodZ
MSELGRLLAEAREARALSHADVEAVTRIRQKYLEAMERGQFSALPSGATGRGLLRTYARFLGLDEAETLRRYAVESGDAGETTPMAEPGHPRLLDYRPVEVRLMDSRPRFAWLLPALGVLLLLAAIGGGVWWLNRNPGWNPLAAFGPAPTATSTPQPPIATRPLPLPTAAIPPPTMTAPAPLPTSDLLPLPTPTVPATVTPTPRPSATPEVTSRLALTVRITQRAWLRIQVDGATALEDTLEAGQTRTWEASRTITLRTGNAGGVNLLLNGQDLGAAGGAGQVVERSWTSEGGNVSEIAVGTITPTLRPTSTPTPTG